MDAAYCSEELRQHGRNLGHVPLIDHNPRVGRPTLGQCQGVHDAEALQELRASVAVKRVEAFEPVNRSTVFDKANVESKAALELFPDSPGIEQYKVAQKLIELHATQN